MSDIDVVEKVLTDQPDLPVHIPYAGNTSPGIASFNTRDFIVEENGAVQLSKDVQALTEEAVQAADNAKQSEQNAAESETNAQQSEQNAQQSASKAAASATNAKSSEQQAQTHLQQVLATETRINNTEDDIEHIAEEVSNDKIEVEELRTEFTEYVTYVESQASVAAEMAGDAQSYSINAHMYMQEAQDAWLQARSEADRAQQISDSIGATFKPKGTITFEELPAQPSVEYEGFLWDISNSFTTDDRFTVGAGQQAPAGSDVSCIETTEGVYKYNISSGLYDLSAYATKTQLDLETETREAADNNLSTRIDAKYTKPSSGIPDSDLSIDIRNSLGKANTAYQKPSSGIPKSDLASTVQSSLGKADTAYQKPSEGIAKTDLASPVQSSLNKADSALQSIPVATSSALGGVKPVAKTDDMTQSVGVDGNGALWTKEASEGTTVVANPTATGTQDLTSLQVGGTVYNIPQGGGAVEYATDEEIDALFGTAEPQDELIGTWVFNDTISSETSAVFSFSFTCNDILYKGINLDHSFQGEEMYYRDTNDDLALVYHILGTWDDPAYQTIQITDISALTNREEFETWLKANATKQ